MDKLDKPSVMFKIIEDSDSASVSEHLELSCSSLTDSESESSEEEKNEQEKKEEVKEEEQKVQKRQPEENVFTPHSVYSLTCLSPSFLKKEAYGVDSKMQKLNDMFKSP